MALLLLICHILSSTVQLQIEHFDEVFNLQVLSALACGFGGEFGHCDLAFEHIMSWQDAFYLEEYR